MTKHKWFKFSIVYLGAIVLSLSQLKVVPVADELASQMGISLTQSALLMSVFTFSALFLAIPGGSLINKYGAKKVGIFVMFCLFLGNIIGAFSSSFYMLLFSRIIEGVSFSFINTIAMVFISQWFKEKGAGVAIGIFGTFSAFASMLGMNLYLPIYNRFGMRSVWLFTAAAAAIATLGFAIFLDDVREKATESEPAATLRNASKNKIVWILALAMGSLSFVLFTFLTIYPKIFTQVYGLSQTTSNYYASLFGLFGIPFGLIAGIIIDRTGKPASLGIITGIGLAIACFITTLMPVNLLLVQVFLLSACISLFSSSVSIAVPKVVKRPSLVGYTFSIIYLFYYIGIFVGPPVITRVVEASGWKMGTIALTIVASFGTFMMVTFALQKESSSVSLPIATE